ncbi:MAG: DUF1841 family protein [Candidatus Thiodiazotropha sp.]
MSSDRNQLRQVFFQAWRKHCSGEAQEPLEAMVSQVILQHPEYHRLLNDQERGLEKEFFPEEGQTNPFLHMSMHLTLLEQVSTDRPTGITGIYQQLCQHNGEAHDVEHRLMECLGRVLWEAQSANRMPDEQAYLECIKRLIKI